MENKLKYNEILTKEPWFQVLPHDTTLHGVFRRGTKVDTYDEELVCRVRTQADFLREYYPEGHNIMSKVLYPDIYKQDPETKKWYVQPIARTAFAFQYIITTKQVVHICGNDLQFELSGKAEEEKKELEKLNSLLDLRQGWLDMNMEEHMYESVVSYKATGDTATVGYFDDDGNACARTFSFLDGDVLYPHRHPVTGKMEIFARKYYGYDEDGKYSSENVEIWDEKFYYRARKGLAKNGVTQRIKEIFGLGGYEIIEKKPHGFPFCPVAYHRDRDGACWGKAQNTIEAYEEAFSYLREDNKSHAFPIMYMKGDGVDIHGDEITGAVKSIEINDVDGEVGFLNKPEVSASYNAELKTLYDMIYEQSFSVKPPELKSGDLPGVAVKLLYSPAIEKAIHDTNSLQHYVDDMVRIVKYGYGKQIGKQLTLANLKVNAWIEPYVHQNDTELFTNLSTAVQNQFISKQTASERIPKFAKNDEFDRIMREDMEKRKRETQEAINQQREILKVQTEEAIKQAKATGKGGQDVNTGGGKTGRTTDKWGNHEGENNWDKYNKTR